MFTPFRNRVFYQKPSFVLISIWICLGFDTQATQPKDFYKEMKSRLRAVKSKLIFFPKNSVSIYLTEVYTSVSIFLMLIGFTVAVTV